MKKEAATIGTPFESADKEGVEDRRGGGFRGNLALNARRSTPNLYESG